MAEKRFGCEQRGPRKQVEVDRNRPVEAQLGEQRFSGGQRNQTSAEVLIRLFSRLRRTSRFSGNN
jgi:hypothetical protein